MIKRSTVVDAGLGHRIRARRKSIGMTQAALASAIGVSFQQVQKYEKGLSSISEDRLHQICEIMQLPPDFFTAAVDGYIGKPAVLTGEDQSHEVEPDPETVVRFLASGEGKRLIESFISITDRRLRTRILDFIASVAVDLPK